MTLMDLFAHITILQKIVEAELRGIKPKEIKSKEIKSCKALLSKDNSAYIFF